jgi:ATP-dependent helicase HepA
MPPAMFRVALNDQLEPLGRQLATPALEPYRRRAIAGIGRDYNLNPARWEVLHTRNLPHLDHWAELCAAAENAAAKAMHRSENFRRHLAAASERAISAYRTREAQLTARMSRLQGTARDAECAEREKERTLHDVLMAVLARPDLRVDVAGAIFVSSVNPFADEP